MSIVGEVIGNYRILELIGSGGMGQVFRGQEVLLERDVAIKALQPELIQQSEVLQRFQLEAKALSRLHHPNIVMLYNFFQHAGSYYMVMEFAKGITLADLMKRCPQGMPWRLCIQLASQVLSALEYAHGMDVIHRDIKPANIMVRDDRLVKVMDFGVARILGSTKLTRTGFMAGTLKYMSPEQIRCADVDARCDQYSTALVLYEMLCGQPPFDEPSEYDMIRAQVEDVPVSLLEKLPALPPKLDALVKKGLAKNPQNRFASAKEFRLMLEDVVNDLHLSESGRTRSGRANPSQSFMDRVTQVIPGRGEDAISTRRRTPSMPGDPISATDAIAPTILTQDYKRLHDKPSRRGVYLGGGVAGLAVAALIGFAVYQSVREDGEPPPRQSVPAATPRAVRQMPVPADDAQARQEIQRLQDEINTLKKTVEEDQNQLHRQALDAARNAKHFDELLAAAPSEDTRLALQASKYEAEYQFNRLTEVETQYMHLSQAQQGPGGADELLRTATSALDAGKIDQAKQGFTQALAAWKQLSEHPRQARQNQADEENRLFSQINGLWGINNCNAPSLWEVQGRRIIVTWPNQTPAEERILAVKDGYVYTTVETQQSRHDIYRYKTGDQSLKVENVTDGRSKILKKCQP